jgi:hypothetical protein
MTTNKSNPNQETGNMDRNPISRHFPDMAPEEAAEFDRDAEAIARLCIRGYISAATHSRALKMFAKVVVGRLP